MLVDSTAPANIGQTAFEVGWDFADVLDCMMPIGIIAADIPADVKTFLLWLWNASGCSFERIRYHPNHAVMVGYADRRTGEALLRQAKSLGFLTVEDLPDFPGWYEVQFTERIWQPPSAASADSRQMTIFPRWADGLPPYFGGLRRLPQLMTPAPLIVKDNRKRPAAQKLVAWRARLSADPTSLETTIEYRKWGELLRRDRANIRRSVQKSDGECLELLSEFSGGARVGFRKFNHVYWEPSAIHEMQDICQSDPRAAGRFLALMTGRRDAWLNGHGAPTLGAQNGGGAPTSGAPCKHGAPTSGLILSESNLISSDQMGFQRIERRARDVVQRLTSCEGMAAFLPILFAVLVELGELDEKTLWRIVQEANRDANPPRKLTAKIKDEVPTGHITEAYAREVLPRFGIVWANELRAQVAKPRRAKTNTEGEEREAQKQRIILAGRKTERTTEEINSQLSAAGFPRDEWLPTESFHDAYRAELQRATAAGTR